MKGCGNRKWTMLLCIAPLFIFIFLKLFFPSLAYLSLFGLLLCPLSMVFMMYFMNKEEKNDENESKNEINNKNEIQQEEEVENMKGPKKGKGCC